MGYVWFIPMGGAILSVIETFLLNNLIAPNMPILYPGPRSCNSGKSCFCLQLSGWAAARSTSPWYHPGPTPYRLFCSFFIRFSILSMLSFPMPEPNPIPTLLISQWMDHLHKRLLLYKRCLQYACTCTQIYTDGVTVWGPCPTLKSLTMYLTLTDFATFTLLPCSYIF